jgi:signal transduction histidine kinase
LRFLHGTDAWRRKFEARILAEAPYRYNDGLIKNPTNRRIFYIAPGVTQNMGLKTSLWPKTIRARLLLLIVPLISVAIMLSGHFLMDRSKAAIVAEKAHYLLGITQLLQQQLAQQGGFEVLEGRIGADQNKLRVLNQSLAPITEQVSKSFSRVGAGFYHRQLDAIVTYGPEQEYGNRVGKAIDANHPGRQVMATGQAAVVSGQFVRGNIMNAMTPIIENGQTVGYIWANELIDDIDKTIEQMRQTVLLISALALFVSLALVYFIITHLTRDIGIIKKGLEGIGQDLNQRLAPLDGESGDIIEAINRMAQSLFESRQKERELAEQALHQQEETLRTAIAAIDEAFVLYDPDDRLVYCNEKYLQMLPQANGALVIGETYEQILRRFFVAGIFSQMRENGEELEREMLVKHRQGESDFAFQTLDGRWLRMIDRKASTGHIVGFRIDITELKCATEVAESANLALHQMNVELAAHREHLQDQVLSRTLALATARAEAETANAVKTRFMANVSHEMRTPLQGILGFAEIGRRRAAQLDIEQTERYFRIIAESGERMSKLVESLLTLTEEIWGEQSGIGAEQIEDINLHDFIAELVLLMEVRAVGHQQHLVIDMQTATASITGDPIRLRQVFEHLIGNALRYSPPEATVTLRLADASLRTPNGEGTLPAISFQVIDQGCGIPEVELKAIFEPFYQSTRTATGAGGTGLGLPLSRSIVARHGGTLTLINQPGGGVVCEVVLPVAR